MTETEQEMTLAEYVGQLPTIHLASRQYHELLQTFNSLRNDLSLITANHRLGKDRDIIRAQKRIRTVFEKARTPPESPEGVGG